MDQDVMPLNLKEACIAMHEMFTSLLEAGFTEGQAIKIIGITTKSTLSDEDSGEGLTCGLQ